jgi:putative transposase
MPNHFHLLLKQIGDSGISKFLSNFQNSYTRYFNVKHERDGSLFLDQFKAIRIESDEQLLHVSRYIHLNPYTGFVIKSEKELETYPWSSYTEYFLDKPRIIEKDILLSFFDSKSSFKKFVFNQADYQKRLKEIQHLIFE